MEPEVIDMNIRIRLFAGIAEQVGQTTVALSVPDDATADVVKTAFATAFPVCAPIIAQTLVAINRSYADAEQTVSPTDEVALIPPVSGGSPEETGSLSSCRITQDVLDVASAYQQLEDPLCGGTVLFSGTVRSWTRGRQSLYLDYDAYQDMALVQMQRIRAEVEAASPGVKTLQWHRVGRLLPTDIAVICAASAPHREAAFTAAKTLIDRLKKEVPIWKKEFYADGETTWQSTP